jgi:glycosyltransferase involved in cell wall biosynthesis
MLATFLSQTYENKTLIIINDDNRIELECDYDNVICYNINKKLLLDVKRNIGVSSGDYDIIMPWDDDDIFLPNRIANHVERHIENPEAWLYRNMASYTIHGDEFKMAHTTPNAISFLKKAWFQVGGYDNFLSIGSGDGIFYDRMPNKLVEDDKERIDHVYGFGNINYHISCMRDNENDVEQIAYNQLKDLDLLGKKYKIVPDYEQYNNFLILDKLWRMRTDWKNNNDPMKIKHTGYGKMDITETILKCLTQ